MSTKGIGKKILSSVLAVIMMLSVIAPAAMAATATALGGNLTMTLYNQGGTIPNSNVELLRKPADGTSVKEGEEYYLTRVDEIYEIFDEDGSPQDLNFVAHMSYNFANANINPVYYYNNLRYFSIIEAETGNLVVDGNVDDIKMSNNSQIGTITVPHKYLKAETAYYVIFGSSTCGNNPAKILIAPVVYRITTGNADRTATVDTSFDDVNALKQHDITLNVINSDTDSISTAGFNRFASTTWGSGAVTNYVVGDPITASVPGQEIAVKATAAAGMTSTMQVETKSGYHPSIHNMVSGIGGNFTDYNDTRFTMPNEDVAVNIIFGYKVSFSYEDGGTVPTDSITVTDANGRIFNRGIVAGTLTNNAGTLSYNGEVVTVNSDGTIAGDDRYVLPEGDYTYTISDSGKISKGTFTVSMDERITVALTASALTTTTVTDGVATVTVNDTALANELDSADSSEKFVFVPDVDDADEITELNLALSAGNITDIADNTAGVTIKTPMGDLSIPSASLKDITGDAVITIAAAEDGAVSVTISVGGNVLTDLLDGLTVCIPAAYTSTTVAVTVGADGTQTVVKKAVVVDGSMVIPLSGSATVKIAEKNPSFVDVTSGYWYYDYIMFTSDRELFKGTSDTEFSPNGNMSRAMLATVLHRLENEPESGQGSFSDLESGWYTDAVNWAASVEIVNGVGDNRFAPNESITREQLVTMIYRYYHNYLEQEAPQDGDTSVFQDNGKISDWAENAMSWAVGAKIIQGKDSRTIDPSGNANRAEVATILQRLIELMAE